MGTRTRLTLTLEPVVESTPRPEVKDAKRILDNVVVLDITFHRPGIRRKADLGLVETEIDKRMLGLTKAIVDSEEYTGVCRVANDARHWLEVRSLPSPLKRGTYLVPIALIGDVNERLEKVDVEYAVKADVFAIAYPSLVESAKERLGNQFDPENYPRVEALRAAFWIERRLLDFGVPSEEKIGKELWKREKDRAENTWREAAEEIQEALRCAFRSLVGHLAERLEPNPDGTRKKFKDASVEKLLEFIDLFKSRNITGDAELEGLVVQARNVLQGRKPDKLRTSSVVRGEVAGEMSRVQSALDTLLETAPRRAITFKED